MMKTLFLLLFAAPAFSAPLIIDTCASYVLNGNTVTCAGGTTPPPEQCPPGTTGTPPNCTIPPPATCPPGQVGTPPNCTTPPPTAGMENCAQHGLSVIGNTAYDLSFTTASSRLSGTGFGDNVAWVFKLTVPPGTAPTTRQGQFQVAEYSSQPTPRHLVISKVPCDFFRALDAYGASGPINKSVNGTTAYTNFQVGLPASYNDFGKMTAGETYYFSARNWSEFPLSPPPPGSYSCGAGNQCQATSNYQPTMNQATRDATKKKPKAKPKKH